MAKRIRFNTLDGGTRKLDRELIDGLDAATRGTLLRKSSRGYNKARQVWNAMIDRKPACILQCAGIADVIQGVRFARRYGLELAVRGAGHNIAGTAVSDGGLLLDLSGWRSVHVDPVAKTARIEPGATLGDIDHETQAFGLALPVGINSTTGIAGLTLGGGFGWISRKYGLTIDNLRSVDIVTADGQLRNARSDHNAELFWALRGGGGNFGVVTSFEFNLHDVGPEVLAGLIVHPYDDARDVLRHYRKCVSELPDDITAWALLRKAPPLPFIPDDWHGKDVCILAVCCAGDMAEADRKLTDLRRFGNPIADVVGPHPFKDWQAAFDPLLTEGARNYWKSHNFGELPDTFIDVAVDYGARLPSSQSEIFIASVGGVVNRIAPDATAYPHRDANFVMNVHTRWERPKNDDKCVDWAREFFNATRPFATGGVYVNFISAGEERVPDAYGENLERLRQIKHKYDPDNLFRVNQNISGEGPTPPRPDASAPS